TLRRAAGINPLHDTLCAHLALLRLWTTGSRPAAVGNYSTYSEGVVPPLRSHRRDPEGRRGPAGRRPGGLEGRWPAAAGRYLPAAHRPPRRRWVLAVLRIVAGAAG